jgi:hypothetical protein
VEEEKFSSSLPEADIAASLMKQKANAWRFKLLINENNRFFSNINECIKHKESKG